VIALKPETRAQSFQAALRSAKAFRAIWSNRVVADFARKGIGAVIETTFGQQTAPDSRRNRHIEQRPGTGSRAVMTLTQSAYHCVPIHNGINAKTFSNRAHKIEIRPAFHVRRTDHALPSKVDRAAKPDTACVYPIFTNPRRGKRLNLLQHPIRTAAAVRSARAAFYKNVALKEAERQFRAADIYCQCVHA
jgi:hypothetical protein